MKNNNISIDPVTFEIIRHRLFQIVDEAIIALENVSGSPITNEGHDMMVSLYRANGGLLVGGVGFLHHLTSAAQAVKHIIKDYSEDPGIFEGDIFFSGSGRDILCVNNRCFFCSGLRADRDQ